MISKSNKDNLTTRKQKKILCNDSKKISKSNKNTFNYKKAYL
jgi:hypothetical protein